MTECVRNERAQGGGQVGRAASEVLCCGSARRSPRLLYDRRERRADQKFTEVLLPDALDDALGPLLRTDLARDDELGRVRSD